MTPNEDPRLTAVRDNLRDVWDPELDLDFVDLGLIYDITITATHADITFTLTTPGCPIVDVAARWIEEAAIKTDGITTATATLTWTPVWNPHMMSDDAKFAFGY